jgi:hypothetical protein
MRSGQPLPKMHCRNRIGHTSRLNVTRGSDTVNRWHQQRGRRDTKRHGQSHQVVHVDPAVAGLDAA